MPDSPVANATYPQIHHFSSTWDDVASEARQLTDDYHLEKKVVGLSKLICAATATILLLHLGSP